MLHQQVSIGLNTGNLLLNFGFAVCICKQPLGINLSINTYQGCCEVLASQCRAQKFLKGAVREHLEAEEKTT